jgi:ParB-like chromosome segregation protein Spo0J
MKIIERNIDDLKPYRNNPRRNEAAVEPVSQSIKAFGFKVPLVIDRNDVVVTGHTRLLAAKKLGLEKVPCIVADDLTESQINAFRLADNKVSELSTWDWKSLRREIEDLKASSINLEYFGFDLGSLMDDDVSSYFEDAGEHSASREKKAKTVRCPYCGEPVEL